MAGTPADPDPAHAAAETADTARRVRTTRGEIRLWRDNHYQRKGFQLPFPIQEGDYFALGDNSPNSFDGRYWGNAPGVNLVGKAFFVFWPLWPWDLRLQFIR